MGFLMSSPQAPALPPLIPSASPATLASPAVGNAANNQKAAAAAAAVASGMNPTTMSAPSTAASKLLGPS